MMHHMHDIVYVLENYRRRHIGIPDTYSCDQTQEANLVTVKNKKKDFLKIIAGIFTRPIYIHYYKCGKFKNY